MSVSKAKQGSVAGVAGGYAPLDSGLLVPAAYQRGNAWVMSLSSSQTLTNDTSTTITFDRADVDGGGSVIDLANNRFVTPATGIYMVIANWLWEGTAPLETPYIEVLSSGTQVALFRTPSPTAATAVLAGSSGYNASGVLSFTSGANITMQINPRAVSGVTARGNASARLSTSFAMVRFT